MFQLILIKRVTKEFNVRVFFQVYYFFVYFSICVFPWLFNRTNVCHLQFVSSWRVNYVELFENTVRRFPAIFKSLLYSFYCYFLLNRTRLLKSTFPLPLQTKTFLPETFRLPSSFPQLLFCCFLSFKISEF